MVLEEELAGRLGGGGEDEGERGTTSDESRVLGSRALSVIFCVAVSFVCL